MIIDANDLPTEGMGSSQQLINNIMGRYGAEASLDVIMRNMPQIARQLGAKKPAVLRNHPPMQNMPTVPPQPTLPNQIPSKQEQTIDMPDTPNKLHTPPAKMVAGAEAVPKIPMTEEELSEFNKRAAEMPRPPMPTVPPISADSPYAAFMYPPRPSMPPPPLQQPQQSVKPSYFRDGLGNEYKIIGNELYVLGWQDAKVKVRMINAETGKEIPSKGRKFQIYGWHLVEKMDGVGTPTEADDVSKFEKEVVVDDEPKVDNTVSRVAETSIAASNNTVSVDEAAKTTDDVDSKNIVDRHDMAVDIKSEMDGSDNSTEIDVEDDVVTNETVVSNDSDITVSGSGDTKTEVPYPPKRHHDKRPQNRRLI